MIETACALGEQTEGRAKRCSTAAGREAALRARGQRRRKAGGARGAKQQSLRPAEARSVPQSPCAAAKEPAVQQPVRPRGSASTESPAGAVPRERAAGGTAAREDPCGAVCSWRAATCCMRR